MTLTCSASSWLPITPADYCVRVSFDLVIVCLRKSELFTLDLAPLPYKGAPNAPTSGNMRVLIANQLGRRGILYALVTGSIFDSPKRGSFQHTIIGYYLS